MEANHGAQAKTSSGAAEKALLACATIETSFSALVVTDPRAPGNPIVCANAAFLRLTGYTLEEVVGRNCAFLQGPDTHPLAVAAFRDAIHRSQSAAVTLVNYRKDGTRFLCCVQIRPILDEEGRALLFIGTQAEVTSLEMIFPMSEVSRFEVT